MGRARGAVVFGAGLRATANRMAATAAVASLTRDKSSHVG